jgi:hypothetical protein
MNKQQWVEQIQQVLAEIDALPDQAVLQRQSLQQLLISLEQQLMDGATDSDYSMLENIELIGVEIEAEHPVAAMMLRNLVSTINTMGV